MSATPTADRRVDRLATADGVELHLELVGPREARSPHERASDSASDVPLVVVNGVFLAAPLQRLADRRRVVFYDPRNRGRSAALTRREQGERGVHHDVDDVEAVRVHLGAERIDLLGHSYLALMVALYAMRHPARVRRLVMLGAPPPRASTVYPPELTGADEVHAAAMSRIAALRTSGGDPTELPRRAWEVIRTLYTSDPADAGRVEWPSGIGNETLEHVMRHLHENVYPSLQALALDDADFARAGAPTLVVHGRRDRQSPWGAGREWALRLPQARLLTLDAAAHLPWIEQPTALFAALDTFLAGHWPADAERIDRIDPANL